MYRAACSNQTVATSLDVCIHHDQHPLFWSTVLSRKPGLDARVKHGLVSVPMEMLDPGDLVCLYLACPCQSLQSKGVLHIILQGKKTQENTSLTFPVCVYLSASVYSTLPMEFLLYIKVLHCVSRATHHPHCVQGTEVATSRQTMYHCKCYIHVTFNQQLSM